MDFFESVEIAPLYDDGFDDIEANVNEATRKNAADALVGCVNRYGRVDIKYISATCGLPVERVVTDLRGTIFQDPTIFDDEFPWNVYDGWLLRSQYLCGNIWDKLVTARKMNRKFSGHFQDNIKALKSVLPDALELEDIHISLGAPWVPVEVYIDFIADLLRFKESPEVYLNKELSVWKVDAPKSEVNSVLNTSTYGTYRISAVKIIEQTMNARTVIVNDYIWDSHRSGYDHYKPILNREETLLAQEKQKAIISAFNSWLYNGNEHRDEIEEAYNDAFAGYTHSPYDGSFLEFSDLNPDIKLYDYQKNAVARILLSNDNVLLAHDVGTGKTYEMVCGVHELKRTGLSDKNLVVVPKNVLKATVDAHKFLYPNDKILAIYSKDFNPTNRNAVLRQIRDGDYTAIYMAYSSFDMIKMSKDYNIKQMQKEISELKIAAANAQHDREENVLKREIKLLEKKLSKYMVEGKETEYLSFDKLGITTLVVDEAHNYKNVPLYSRTDNIVGMNAKGSTKCEEMAKKCGVVDRLIFATGTPLTNSLADLFTLQAYLQPEVLKVHQIDTFDLWINTFGERQTNFEIDIDGNNLRPKTRFSCFHNLTELMAMFTQVCDFHNTDNNSNDLPTFNGYENVEVEKSKALSEYLKELSKRCEFVRAKEVKRTEDNLLKITTDGRKSALDVRLAGKFDDIDKPTKTDRCAEKVKALYDAYPGTCQIVFSDIGTPNKTGFNIYDDLKFKLVCMGIPEDEIAFVHDATSESARSKLFAKMNNGTVRVVIGSTAKLGIGVNVQERLIALHHLSVPWKPADLVQREGRIIRQGNTSAEVFIYRYITKGSFDSYSWQLLENKQRFISSFLSGTSASRNADDISDSVLSYAEVKALAIGNPLIKKRVETANLLEHAKIAYRQRQKELNKLKNIMEIIPRENEDMVRKIENIRKDAAYYKEEKRAVPKDKRIAFGKKLLRALKKNHMKADESMFNNLYQGFAIVLPAYMDKEKPFVYVSQFDSDGNQYRIDMDTDKPMGCSMRIDRLLDNFEERERKLTAAIVKKREEYGNALADYRTGNSHEDEVAALKEELAAIDREIELSSDDDNE